jgi:ribonuclease HI
VRQTAENTLTIYTDGSCYSSPRRGGAGFLFVTINSAGDEVVHEESPPGWLGATNNQMELQAVIEALGMATGRHPPVDPDSYKNITVCTDSMYVAENFPRALHEWSKTGWTKRGGAPVANTHQWREIVKLVRRAARVRKRIDIEWIKGHKKDPYNRRADKLAKTSAKTPSSRVIRPARIRRKKSPNSVDIGSIPMQGQEVHIHVITDEYLPPPHKCYRYMYEILDPESPYNELVDKATSNVLLNAGHYYRVRLNTDQSNPQIAELLEELVGAPTEPAPQD